MLGMNDERGAVSFLFSFWGRGLGSGRVGRGECFGMSANLCVGGRRVIEALGEE